MRVRPGAILLLVLLGSGCRVFKTAVDAPGQAVMAVTGKQNKSAVDPVELEQTLLRFTDEFATQMTFGINNLRRGTALPSPAEVLEWKIALNTEVNSIASGPNAIANLMDMTVLVTVLRAELEEYWEPKVFGASARPILDSCRSAETEVWRLIGTVLTPQQQAELREAITQWHRQNPIPENLLSARAVGLTSQMVKPNNPNVPKASSVFDLLNLDPLAGLDPATREIAQTRLFAVRALFVAQRMPTLIRWQTELLAINAVSMPEVKQVVTNSSQIAASVERFARVAEQLPGQLSQEREAILKSLDSQEKTLTPLVKELRETLSAGTEMSTSLNTTIKTFDGLMKLFGIGDTNSAAAPPDTNSTPFRVQDYGETAMKVEAMAKQITELVRAVDQTIDSTNISRLTAQVTPAVQQAQAGGKDVVDYAFRKALLFLALVFVAALAYRFLGARMAGAGRKDNARTPD